MGEPLSERRMAENEVVFRQHNEQVQKSFDKINQVATEEGEEKIAYDSDTPMHFYCECSDNDCRERIRISLKDYNKIHESRDKFTIICGHDVAKIEDVTSVNAEYCVVTKHVTPPQSAGGLNVTEVTNV